MCTLAFAGGLARGCSIAGGGDSSGVEGDGTVEGGGGTERCAGVFVGAQAAAAAAHRGGTNDVGLPRGVTSAGDGLGAARVGAARAFAAGAFTGVVAPPVCPPARRLRRAFISLRAACWLKQGWSWFIFCH